MHFSIFLYIKCLKNWKESFPFSWAMVQTCSNSYNYVKDFKSFVFFRVKSSYPSELRRGPKIVTVLVPTVGSTWLIISIFGYLWLRNRGEKGKDKASIKTEGR
jgi:hypothetical protein